MGTDARAIVVDGDPALLDDIEAFLTMLENRWSRFRDDSDVSRLNRASGRWSAVSPATVTLVDTAVLAWAATAGRFDPTIHDALVAAGYDRSYRDLPTDTGRRPAPGAAPGCHDVMVDRDAGSVRLPPHVHLDPGGIGKGLAADLAVQAFASEAGGLCIDIGGDLRVTGRSPRPDGWRVALDTPAGVHLRIHNGAVATSSTTHRTWTTAGEHRHHLIDPRTGLVATTELSSVTVVAGTGWWAEAAATAALLGPTLDQAQAVLAARVERAVIVSRSGAVIEIEPTQEPTPWIPKPGGTSPEPAVSSPGA